MKKLMLIVTTMFIALAFNACNGNQPEAKPAYSEEGQDIRIITADNKEGKITTKSIEAAFAKVGFVIDGNNNMNAPFKPRFGKTYYKTYHLFTVHSSEFAVKLIKKYPKIALETPFSMSLYSNKEDGTVMNISSLTLRGISRITEIPMDDPDLIAYYALLTKGLKEAMPNGTFTQLAYKEVAPMTKPLQTLFEAELGGENEDEILEAKDDFEAEFEGEMEPIGFLFPGFVDINSDLQEAGVIDYDYFDTYSVCKLDVIYPIHQEHPEVGAFAPCTFYIYKKKGDPITYMGFPAVGNWITATDLKDDKSVKPLLEAEKLFEDTVNAITE